MGLFEEFEAYNKLAKFCQDCNDFRSFNCRSLLYKKINLDYSAASDQPWLYFNCKDNEKYSFKIHDLQLKEDSTYWHLAAQRKKKAVFNGFISHFYDLGIGTLRGYISPKDEMSYNQRLGVYVRAGKVIGTRTEKEIYESMHSLTSIVVGLIKCEKRLEKAAKRR
jgi:hypothetical protein